MSWHEFDASGAEGTCLWCGRRLRQHYTMGTRVYVPAVPKQCPSCDGTRLTVTGPFRLAAWQTMYRGGFTGYACADCDRTFPGAKEVIEGREKRYDKPGDYGDGFFCGLRCAYQFAVRMAELGKRLVPAKAAGGGS